MARRRGHHAGCVENCWIPAKASRIVQLVKACRVVDHLPLLLKLTISVAYDELPPRIYLDRDKMVSAVMKGGEEFDDVRKEVFKWTDVENDEWWTKIRSTPASKQWEYISSKLSDISVNTFKKKAVSAERTSLQKLRIELLDEGQTYEQVCPITPSYTALPHCPQWSQVQAQCCANET